MFARLSAETAMVAIGAPGDVYKVAHRSLSVQIASSLRATSSVVDPGSSQYFTAATRKPHGDVGLVRAIECTSPPPLDPPGVLRRGWSEKALCCVYCTVSLWFASSPRSPPRRRSTYVHVAGDQCRGGSERDSRTVLASPRRSPPRRPMLRMPVAGDQCRSGLEKV
ncbi:hypothetical protein BC827DRAFT_245912 [Russula dissimulans]|nr:hypothetical protein BC827DRAFT_245912 [Russula dissimulans]